MYEKDSYETVVPFKTSYAVPFKTISEFNINLPQKKENNQVNFSVKYFRFSLVQAILMIYHVNILYISWSQKTTHKIKENFTFTAEKHQPRIITLWQVRPQWSLCQMTGH